MADKAGRFTFDDTCDVVLVRIVDMAEAHVATYSGVAAKWQGARAMIVASHELQKRVKDRGCPAPTWHTLQERFKLMIKKRREYVKKQEKASGASEEYGEFETFLDAMILQMDDKKDRGNQEKDAEYMKKKQLREAREGVRGAAVKRSACDADTTGEVKPNVKKVKVERAELATWRSRSWT